MGLLSFFRKVYDLDTLDTRFTNASSVPYQTVIDARKDPGANPRRDSLRKPQTGEPPKWKTPEFYFYYVILVAALPSMFWVAYEVSRPSDSRYHNFEHFLTDGWIPGRKIDVSDAQYHVFRVNLPYMSALCVFHPLLRKLWNRFYPTPGRRIEGGSNRLDQRASFDYVFSFLFLLILHGLSAFKILLILVINYNLATKLPRRLVPLATWTFNIGILFANELCKGYFFRNMAFYISPPEWQVFDDQIIAVDSPLMAFGGKLDRYRGLLARWEVLFNFTILRLISFNLDYYWSIDRGSSNSLEKKQLDPANLSERDRVSIPAEAKDFNFRNYIGYAIYAPLYLAGPILTFNDYIAQAKYRAATIETPRTIRYAVRFVLVLLSMELILHFDYVGAISKARPEWSSYSAAQLSLLSFFNLHIIWLKLLLPWRLFRLWSLIDGIDPPENMIRCVSNNFSTQRFWRAWHRSYNRWLIRYLYVPLGGASFRNWRTTARSVITYLLAFTFVALWHDIQLQLLIWGWLIVLFMVPEWVASAMFPKRKWENHLTQYRMLCAVGSVVNVLMMMAANLVGFAVGLDGLHSIVSGILDDWSGVLFMTVACFCLFVGVQLMFEIRESEVRRGVTLKC